MAVSPIMVWLRRDLRLFDNTALHEAIKLSSKEHPVLCVFIFDTNILNDLPPDDPRVSFIYNRLLKINQALNQHGSSLLMKHGKPNEIWNELIHKYHPQKVLYNRDYEPYALERDRAVNSLLASIGIEHSTHKDHLIFEPGEVLKADGSPYTVYTPYKNKWLDAFSKIQLQEADINLNLGLFFQENNPVLQLTEIGFKNSQLRVQEPNYSVIQTYDQYRDYPAMDAVGYFGPHLRFGTVSIRQLVRKAANMNLVFLEELIWREFFQQIMYHFPEAKDTNFKRKYDYVKWRNNEQDFKLWCAGNTGFPMVDAGMRQLNATGYMHNRVRMITAGFLTKHLLIDWRLGEAYFAEKLLDYELASNNGNWQWAAGTGCDAAPYFRIFNPETQLKKFDKQGEYVSKWVPEWGSAAYVSPLVEHKFARDRALRVYKEGLAEYEKRFTQL